MNKLGRAVDWPRHKATCVLDPRAKQEDAFNIAIQMAIENDKESFMARNCGSSVVNRYTNILKYKAQNVNDSNDLNSYQWTVYQKSKEKANQNENYVLMNTTKVEDHIPCLLALKQLELTPIDQTTYRSINKLKNKANKCFQKGHYINAVKNLTKAIISYEKDKPVTKMKDQDKTELAKIYAKRAESNLKMGKEKKSEIFIQRVTKIDYNLKDFFRTSLKSPYFN
jgi:hypothetical protein